MGGIDLTDEAALIRISRNDKDAQSASFFGLLQAGHAQASRLGALIVAHGAFGFEDRFDVSGETDVPCFGFFERGGLKDVGASLARFAFRLWRCAGRQGGDAENQAVTMEKRAHD